MCARGRVRISFPSPARPSLLLPPVLCVIPCDRPYLSGGPGPSVPGPKRLIHDHYPQATPKPHQRSSTWGSCPTGSVCCSAKLTGTGNKPIKNCQSPGACEVIGGHVSYW